MVVKAHAGRIHYRILAAIGIFTESDIFRLVAQEWARQEEEEIYVKAKLPVLT